MLTDDVQVEMPEVRFPPSIVVTRNWAAVMIVGGYALLFVVGRALFFDLEAGIAEPSLDLRAEQATQILGFVLLAVTAVSLYRILRHPADA